MTILKFFRVVPPLFLLSVLLTYMLGAGVARYYGISIKWEEFCLGYLWLISLQLGLIYLLEYFKGDDEIAISNSNYDRIAYHYWCLAISFTFFAFVASLSGLIIRAKYSPSVFITMGAFILSGLSYSVPVFRFRRSGFGELLLSFYVANLTPIWGFQLQSSDSLRFVVLVAFPVTVLFLAMQLVFNLRSYAVDLKKSNCTLMIRLGWQNGILLHNLLVFCAYLLLLLAVSFGLPLRVCAPAFLTLPLAIAEIWMVNKIANGAKPQWNYLRVVSIALFGITVYLLTFSFWSL